MDGCKFISDMNLQKKVLRFHGIKNFIEICDSCRWRKNMVDAFELQYIYEYQFGKTTFLLKVFSFTTSSQHKNATAIFKHHIFVFDYMINFTRQKLDTLKLGNHDIFLSTSIS